MSLNTTFASPPRRAERVIEIEFGLNATSPYRNMIESVIANGYAIEVSFGERIYLEVIEGAAQLLRAGFADYIADDRPATDIEPDIFDAEDVADKMTTSLPRALRFAERMKALGIHFGILVLDGQYHCYVSNWFVTYLPRA